MNIVRSYFCSYERHIGVFYNLGARRDFSMCWSKGTFSCVVTRVAQNLVLLVCLLNLKKDIFKRVTEDIIS